MKAARQVSQSSNQLAPGQPIDPAATLTEPGEVIAHQMCQAMRAMPFTELYTFARTLARDLGSGDDPVNVVRVAEALLATAEVWHIAE